MLIIEIKNETTGNEYEVKGNVVYLKLKKKNGATIDTKIDAGDLQMVLDGGIWVAEWHKDFNSYLAQHYIDGTKHKEKQTLHSFILGADPKEPIRHLNGDTLDNRRCNLEIYNKNTPNDYRELDAETAAVILRDNYGRENGRTIIDKDDLDKVIGNGYTWIYYRRDKKPYAVANTPSGRVYLNNYVMDAADDITTHHINLNTLDNRKSNLKSAELVNDSNESTDL